MQWTPPSRVYLSLSYMSLPSAGGYMDLVTATGEDVVRADTPLLPGSVMIKGLIRRYVRLVVSASGNPAIL